MIIADIKIVLDTYTTDEAKRYMKRVNVASLTDPCSLKQVFECLICRMQTNYAQSMYRHMATQHTAPKQYFCPHCSKEFANSVYMTKHVRTCLKYNL